MYIGQCVSHYSFKCQSSNDQSIITCIVGCLLGVSNGPIQFESARKIWPLLELLPKLTSARLLVLAKFLQVLACSDFG